MADFGSTVLGIRLVEHYGMPDVHIHLLPGVLLFFTSVVGIIVAHFSFGFKFVPWGGAMSIGIEQRELLSVRSPFLRGFAAVIRTESGLLGWQSVSAGVLFAGLIGLGRALEHVFESYFIFNFFHYLHIIAPPLALYFFYKGVLKHTKRREEPFLLPKIILGTAIIFLVSGILAMLSSTVIGHLIEELLLFIAIIPTLVFFGITFKLIIKEYGKHSVFIPTVSTMVVSTASAGFFISLERFASIFGYLGVYVFSHEVSDLFLTFDAAAIIIYVGGIFVMKKQLSDTKEQSRRQKLFEVTEEIESVEE